jgi:hypothetical protein
MQMQVPLASPEIGDRHALASALAAYGVAALTTLSNPYVLATYRLAIAEAPGNTELGQILDASGRQPNRRALVQLLRRGQAAGFLGPGEPDRIGREFFALLIGDLMVWLLLRDRRSAGRRRDPVARRTRHPGGAGATSRLEPRRSS